LNGGKKILVKIKMNNIFNVTCSSQMKIPQFSKDPLKAMEFYMEYGFQIEFKIWSELEMNEINEQADKMQACIGGDYLPIMHGDRKSPVFLRSAKNPRVIAIIEKLLGGRTSGLQTVYYFGKPGSKGFPLHQDNFFVRSHKDMFVTAWSPMIDVNLNSGCLVAYPGSHREEILEVIQKQSSTSIGQPPGLECILPSGYMPLVIDAPKGSCVFIHGHTVHSSAVNLSDLFRRTFLTTYLKEGAVFQAGKSGRMPIKIYD
jgi:phytanoyl-CoA hydroxylase